MDIAIIGAGPAGNWLACLLAKEGINCMVFEEHNVIGKPIQCTGIVTSVIEDIVPLSKEVIINRIKKAQIFVGNKKVLDFNFKKANLVLDRSKFDKSLAERAKKAGAKYFLSHKLIGLREGNKLGLIFSNGKKYDCDILIGADGPNTLVGRLSGLVRKRDLVFGLQSRVKGRYDSEGLQFYLGYGEFAWVVPESNEIARVGLVSKLKTLDLFKDFLKIFKNNKKLEMEGGAIPSYDPKLKLEKDKRIFLLGDAAGQVKGVSRGGIIQGLLAAKELSKAIISGDFKYQKRLKKISKDLWYNLMARKFLDSLSKEEYMHVFSIFEKNKKLKQILQERERDFPSRFLIGVLLKEPKLWSYVLRFLFKL